MRIAQYPPAGGSAWITEEKLCVGGEAANSAIAFSAWGLETLLVGTVLGRDERASWLLEALGQLPHIDASWLTASYDADTPSCNIMATPDGERTMFGRHFNTMRGQKLLDLPPAKVFTLDPYCGSEVITAALAADAADMTIIAMDTTGNPALSSIADVVVTSYQELQPGQTQAQSEETTRQAAIEYGVTHILTLGPNGSVAFDPRGNVVHRQESIRIGTVLDATGCGDIYRAGLVCGFVNDWPIQKTMAFASAAAALNLMGLGGGGHVLTLDDTLAIAERGAL